jgi:proton glutamate symport protein
MKKNFLRSLPNHWFISIGMVLGIVVGVLFKVPANDVTISFVDGTSVRLQEWNLVAIQNNAKDSKEFKATDVSLLIKYVKSNIVPSKSYPTLYVFYNNGGNASYGSVADIKKTPSIVSYIKPLGDLFLRLLGFVAVPLVLCSLIVGAASLKDIKQVGRIGLKTLTIFMVTTTLAITIGLVLANTIQPGLTLSPELKTQMLEASTSASLSEKMQQNLSIDLVDFVVSIVPKNPIDAMAKGEMIQIVFIAIFFGIALTLIPKTQSEKVVGVLDGISSTLIKMVEIIMMVAPIGVFALLASTVSDFGFEIVSTLSWYMATVLGGLVFMVVFVYAPMVRYYGGIPFGTFFKAIREVQAVAFGTSSSAATLPVTIDTVEKKLKVPNSIAGFVLPLGATINMDGTALYQGVATLFIAQVFGLNLDITQQLTVVFTAVLASIGTAPVPGVGLVMLIIILRSVHVPVEGIALIMGVDRVLDMCRTISNVTGDIATTIVVAKSEGVLTN